MNKAFFVIFGGLIAATPAQAAEMRASWVEAVNNDVKCLQSKNGWIFDSTGPCPNFVRPDTIAIGKTFQADGTTIPINIIMVVTDDKNPGVVTCVAASDRSQIPFDDTRANRVWLYMPRCIPVN